MKKIDLSKIALMGIAGGLILSGESDAASFNQQTQLNDGVEIARAGCLGRCPGSYKSHRNRRFGGPLADAHGEEGNGETSCSASGSCEGMDPEKKKDNGDTDHSCGGHGGCGGL